MKFSSAISILQAAAITMAMTVVHAKVQSPKQKVASFHLSPTALLHDVHSDRETHPQVAAVYAGLDRIDHVVENDASTNDANANASAHMRRLVEEHNALVDDFNAQRHLSRLERMRRSNAKAGPRKLEDYDYEQEEEESEEEEYYDDDEKIDDDDNEYYTMNGGAGAFDAYQTVPLSQGYGTHFATAWVGSPMPQPQTLIVDTGSHRTAFPCLPCKNCGESYHSDPFFNPEESESYEQLECDRDEDCAFDVKCSSGECKMSQHYSEGSSWSAYQARDLFFLSENHSEKIIVEGDEDYYYDEEGGDDSNRNRNSNRRLNHYNLDALDVEYGIPFVFGCQSSITGLFKTQLADGIMGMSAEEDIISNQMFNLDMIENNMFSMCFRRELNPFANNPKGGDKTSITAGILTIGGVDRRIERSPLVFARDVREEYDSDWYTVKVKKLLLREGGGQHAQIKSADKIYTISDNVKQLNSGDGVIVDSGTTDTYFQSKHASAFKKLWKQITGSTFSNGPMKLTHEELLKLPTVLVQLEAFGDEDTVNLWEDPNDVVGLAGTIISPDAPHDVLVAIPATHYMEYSPKQDSYTPRIYFNESSGGLLGANAMMNHDVVFDWNGRVGFAESDCNYDELLEDIGFNPDDDANKQGDGVNKDCVLGPESISLDCTESVNYADCDSTGKDLTTVLHGTTKWEMVVENEGIPSGEHCDAVAKRRFDTSSSKRIKCGDNGICEVVIPCTMTCEEYQNEVIMNAEDAEDNREKGVVVDYSKSFGKCPNPGWGTCLDTCEQSKVSSMRMEDAQCHVTKTETRSCHIDSCGRSDPCRVPFVVHAILLLADADPTKWTFESEDTFVESFANVMNMDQEDGEEYFGPGDVKIYEIGEWKDEDGLFEEEDSIEGMQVVLEISIFNENAVLPSSPNSNSTKSIADKGKGMFSFIAGPKKTTCKESDIYQLSKQALAIHLELGRDEFMYELLSDVRQDKGSVSMESSVFQPYKSDGESLKRSTVLTSWTIKSEVGIFSIKDGRINGNTRTAVKENLSVFMVLGFMLFCVCYCGVCTGTCLTRRRYEKVIEAKQKLFEQMRQKKEDKERGKYSQLNVPNGESHSNGVTDLGVIDDFHDHPTEDDAEEPQISPISRKNV